MAFPRVWRHCGAGRGMTKLEGTLARDDMACRQGDSEVMVCRESMVCAGVLL